MSKIWLISHIIRGTPSWEPRSSFVSYEGLEEIVNVQFYEFEAKRQAEALKKEGTRSHFLDFASKRVASNRIITNGCIETPQKCALEQSKKDKEKKEKKNAKAREKRLVSFLPLSPPPPLYCYSLIHLFLLIIYIIVLLLQKESYRRAKLVRRIKNQERKARRRRRIAMMIMMMVSKVLVAVALLRASGKKP